MRATLIGNTARSTCAVDERYSRVLNRERVGERDETSSRWNCDSKVRFTAPTPP